MAKITWIAASGLIVAAVSFLYAPVSKRVEVLGITRPVAKIVSVLGEDLRIIDNTLQCEDVHVHHPSGLLFAACQPAEEPEARFSWFPPNEVFTDASAAGNGSIYVVNPTEFTSQKLELIGFTGPFVTHGIDIYSSENEPNSVYIFAVNHLPNPAYYTSIKDSTSNEKARSQIEIFHHTIGTKEAKHLRTVRDPLIRTPNDLLATGPTSFFTTNDHYYREGIGRFFENAGTQQIAPWTDTVHVQITDMDASDPTAGITTTIALDGMHNNNGLGHGRPSRPHEIAMVDAAGGVLLRAVSVTDRDDASAAPKLVVFEQIQLPSTIDNPSWYQDPYPEVGGDASGHVLAGLAHAISNADTVRLVDGLEAVVVWHVRGNGRDPETHARWEQRVVFRDDGTTLRSASAAVLVGIDPKTNGGRKQGWLFVTGFNSKAMIATKIDL